MKSLCMLTALTVFLPSLAMAEATTKPPLQQKPVVTRQAPTIKAAPLRGQTTHQALLAAQDWLKNFNRDLTIEQIQSLRSLQLQLYGNINGTSTQQLFSNDNMRHLKVMTALEVLMLPTWTNDAGLSNVSGLSKLRKLALNNANVTDNGLVHVAGLTELQSLILAGTNVTSQGLTHLKNLQKLEILNLNQVRVTDQDMAAITQLSGLKKLFLVGAQITDASVPLIVKLKRLERLDITGTPITAQGKQAIQRALPHVTIY